MKGFEAVTLTWQDESFTVPANDQLALIAKIEDALCGADGTSATIELLRPGGPRHTVLAAAFGAALRHAGAEVSDEEIYLSIQSDFAAESADASVKINAAIFALLSIVSPPVAMVAAGEDEDAGEVKKKPRKKKKAA